MEAALADLESQEPPNYTATAKKHGVDRSTLSRRHRGVRGTRDDQINSCSLLSKQQQKDLVAYINKLTDQGLPPTNAMVRNFAHDICKKWPGKNWVYRFVDSHKDELKSGYLQGADLSRKKADNWVQYTLYFQQVYNLIYYSSYTNIL